MFQTIFKKPKAHVDSVWGCSWGRSEADGTENIVTGSVDSLVKFWRWIPEKNMLSLKNCGEEHSLGVVSVDIDSHGLNAVSSSMDNSLLLWNIENGKLLKKFNTKNEECWKVKFSPDSKYVVTGGSSGKIHTLSVESGELINSIDVDRKNFILSIAFSPDGNYMAATTMEGKIHIVDINNQKLFQTIDAHDMPARDLAFSSDSRLLYSVSDDTTIKICDFKHGDDIVDVITDSNAWILSIQFSPNGDYFATTGADGTVRIWDSKQKTNLHTFQEHDDMVWSCAWNYESRRLVTASQDASLQIVECPQMEES
ncbi:hypothetical protein SNEBB_008214 [Seison nebaliae]|nr:hypothetical protein SNEBB_008214 [Seison nebaliae]